MTNGNILFVDDNEEIDVFILDLNFSPGANVIVLREKGTDKDRYT